MKRSAILAGLVVLFAAAAAAQGRETLAFRQYPAVIERARVKSINFRSNPGARLFRTRLTNALREGVNFAGHYILTGWGCGTGCTHAAIINARNGNVYSPYQLTEIDATYGDDYSEEQLRFRKNSRLLVLSGRPGTKSENDPAPPSGDYYYEWKNNRLRLIKFVEKSN